MDASVAATAAAPAAASGGGEQKPRRKKKEKKEQLKLSLYINCVAYEYGQVCTFCTKVTAVVHCKECGDFYCSPCDVTAHKTKKRREHVRLIVSSYDLKTAGGYVFRYARMFYIIRQMQRKCRKQFRRFFDRKTLNHYYYNSVYGLVSWRKPYILRKEELKPFIGEQVAAAWIQNGLYRSWLARIKARQELLTQYRRIFDRSRGRFYYAYNGKSRLLPSASWRKPRFCGKRSYPYDIPTVFTPDVAAVVIQRKWRATMLREFFRAMARASYTPQWDPVKGRWNYAIKERQILLERMPLVMRSQPWDPNNVLEWNIERVALFLRRLGLRHLVRRFVDYGVNGRVLLMLDEEDYINMEVFNKVTIRKIQVELGRVFTADMKKVRMSDEHAARREKIRKGKLFNVCAKIIQKNFRLYRMWKELKLRIDIRRVAAGEAQRQKEIARMGVWWINRSDIPSKHNTGHRMEVILPDTTMDEADSDVPALPPIKTFGRRRDHLTCKGWGRFDVSGKWNGIPSIGVEKIGQSMLDVFHPSRIYTHKMVASGYNERRALVFKGLAKNIYNPAVNRKDLLLADKGHEEQLLL